MDEIETSLILPKGALALGSYARYYTEDQGMIHGAYTTRIEVRPPNFGCSEITEDDKLIDVSCPKIANLKPGSRRWVNFGDYPAVSDDDCLALQIMYDPAKKYFVFIECSKVMY